MRLEDVVRLFGMGNLMLESHLEQIEARYGASLRPKQVETEDRENVYYPQFELAVRKEAAEMAAHYEIFYCLEKSIRSLISGKLLELHGAKWWQNKVPAGVKDSAKKNMQREKDSGFTLRSENEIDYITFGELSDIIISNWDAFGDTFSSKKAVTRVMAALNLLRGPIAHCSELAQDEVDRLRLTVRDWFRLME